MIPHEIRRLCGAAQAVSHGLPCSEICIDFGVFREKASFGEWLSMHFDLAHAIVTGIIVFAIMQVFQRANWSDGKRFDWRLVGAIALAVFVLNLVWPT